VHQIHDDERLALDLLRDQHILITHGTGFNWPTPDHVRIVTLPDVETLTDALGRFGEFLSTYRQN
jgi:alanine-synthesizing transaminase